MGEIHGGDEVFVYDEDIERRCHTWICEERIKKGDRVVAFVDDGDCESGPMGPFFEHEACWVRGCQEAEAMAEGLELYEIEHEFDGDVAAYLAAQAEYDRHLVETEKA